jgi:tetratricopeptide (TPR) repeat protein
MVARVNELKRLLQEEPNDDRVLAALGNLHYDAGMWQQAAGYYQRAVDIRPNADMLTDLGVCYRELGDYERALDIFSRAHTLDPAHWQSLYNTMVVAAFDVGRIGVAQQALEAIEAIDPRPTELDQGRLDQLREMLARLAGEPAQPS